jgi:general stress protein 26
MPTDSNERLKKLDDLIESIGIAMLVTENPDSGHLHSRPMQVQGGIDDGKLYFFTRSDSAKVDDFLHERRVQCAFSSPSDEKYVSVAGRAKLSTDQALMKEKWSPLLKAWFPDGVDSPDVALIIVEVDEAQYWDAPNGLMIQAYGAIKAALTGEPVKDAGENERVRVS